VLIAQEGFDELTAAAAKLTGEVARDRSDHTMLVEATDRLLRTLGVYNGTGVSETAKTNGDTREGLELKGFSPPEIEAICEVLDLLADETAKNDTTQ